MIRSFSLMAFVFIQSLVMAQSSFCYNLNIDEGQSGPKTICMTMQNGVEACEPRFVYNLQGTLSSPQWEEMGNYDESNRYLMWEDAYNSTTPQMIIQVTDQCYGPFFSDCDLDNFEIESTFITFGDTMYRLDNAPNTSIQTSQEVVNGIPMTLKTRTTIYTVPLYANQPTTRGTQSQLLKITDAAFIYQSVPDPVFINREFGARVTIFGDEIIGDPLWTTQAPIIPTLILRDPPGDQSYAFLEASSSTCHGYGMSLGSTNSAEAWASVKLGAAGSVGLIAEAEFEIYAQLSGGVEISMSKTSAEEYEMCYTTTTQYQTSQQNGLIGNGDDVFIGTATNYAYGMYKMFSPPPFACGQPTTKNELILSPIGTTNTIVYTQDYIVNNRIPTIQTNLAGMDSSTLAYQTLSDQLEVWEQVIAMNEALKEEATYNLSTSYVAGPGLDYSVSLSTSAIKSVEMNMYIDAFVAAEVGASINGNGAAGGVKVRTRTDQGSTTSSSNQNTNTVGYHLQDDDFDAADFFTLDIRTDNVFGTPVFVLNEQESRSSCPYEGGFQIDQPVLKFADGSTNLALNNIPGGTAPTFQIDICNNSDVGRSYNLKVNPASNTQGAILQGFGENLSSSDFGFEIFVPANGCLNSTTITLSQSSPQTLIYDDIELYLYTFCQPSSAPIYSSIFLDATFVSGTGEEDTYLPKFRIYPNPNNGNFRVEAPKNNSGSSLNLFDVSGRKVFQTQLPATGVLDIGLDHLPAGIYLVELLCADGFKTQRISIY